MSRDKKGKFLPGQSGNPAGRRKRREIKDNADLASILKKKLSTGKVEKLMDTMIDKGIGGDRESLNNIFKILQSLKEHPENKKNSIDLDDSKNMEMFMQYLNNELSIPRDIEPYELKKLIKIAVIAEIAEQDVLIMIREMRRKERKRLKPDLDEK